MAYISTAEWFCLDDVCPTVLGELLPYRNQNHASDTYAPLPHRGPRTAPRARDPARTLKRVDLDAYVLAHHAEWSRLEELLGRRRLDGEEADELVERYQQVATHLSVLRSAAPDPTLVAHLSSLLARARNKSVGARVSSWRRVAHFFTDSFPAALYRLRYWWLGCLAANVVVAAVMMWWLLDHPAVEQSLLSPDQVDQLVNNDFEGYYSEYAASHFAAQVWVNNAWVAALCLGARHPRPRRW